MRPPDVSTLAKARYPLLLKVEFALRASPRSIHRGAPPAEFEHDLPPTAAELAWALLGWSEKRGALYLPTRHTVPGSRGRSQRVSVCLDQEAVAATRVTSVAGL